jgi:hypothetical protein
MVHMSKGVGLAMFLTQIIDRNKRSSILKIYCVFNATRAGVSDLAKARLLLRCHR